MRTFPALLLLILSLLVVAGAFVACDLQPPPKKQAPAPLPTTPGATGDAGTPAKTLTGDAAVAAPPPDFADASIRPAVDAAMDVTDACVAVGTHLAEVVIAGVTDATQKAAYEQQRTQMVRKVAENCTRDKWGDDIRGCFTKAPDVPGLQNCFGMLKPTP